MQVQPKSSVEIREGLSEDEIALRLVTLCRFGCKDDISGAINALNNATDGLLSQGSLDSKAVVASMQVRFVQEGHVCATLRCITQAHIL
jgi:hypothetical protein